ncbi:uncharacterized protein [Phaseolus vulgaris]|uniref:uncharacterized protein n=1 Tax=Phaseolus vulgaris TaxID=3885 RepID=UPI0035CA6940
MDEADKEILETFRKVEVNIPLLDAIKQIPRYAKFLKDLCTHKRRLKGNEKVNMGRNVSALIEKSVAAIPEKCKDPCTFTIPCIIGSNRFENAMLDLGASINVMPLSVFTSLSLGPLKPTDFYILDMGGEDSHFGATTIILGRPFLKIARTKIDVHAGFATKENVVDTHLTTLDDSNPDKLQVAEVSLSNRPSPSIIQPPSLELKPLPNHLKTWVSPIQVVPKKSGITVIKNERNELIPTRVQNNWRVSIDYRCFNQATRKDRFPLPFIDQMLERLAGKTHYCFLDDFSGYFHIWISPEDQHKSTFTCPFGTFAYRRMPFGLCNALGTFQRCIMSIFSDLIEHFIEVFMDDFSIYGSSFKDCLTNLSKLPYPSSVREVRSFLGLSSTSELIPWYVDIVNYLATSIFPPLATKAH